MSDESPTRTEHRITRRAAVALVAPAMLCAGCKLLKYGWTDTFSTTGEGDAKRSSLPAMRRVRDTVGLEIVFAERPLNDPLLTNASLWEGVDTVGELTPDVRKRLQFHGFKVGHMSATLNAAVETLLGLKSEATGARTPVGRMQLAGQRIFRPVGGDTEVQTSRYFPAISVRLDDSAEPFDASNARCVLRVKVAQLDDGFAKLEFTPEIHHGRLGWRPIATEMGLQGTTAQKIRHCFDQRFSLTLNTGEMAVITADSNPADSLGRLFFVDGERGARTQRVLFVRLADVAKSSAPLRDPARPRRK